VERIASKFGAGKASSERGFSDDAGRLTEYRKMPTPVLRRLTYRTDPRCAQILKLLSSGDFDPRGRPSGYRLQILGLASVVVASLETDPGNDGL
jgi:hypothetical protein